jgi:hypothetical protein
MICLCSNAEPLARHLESLEVFMWQRIKLEPKLKRLGINRQIIVTDTQVQQEIWDSFLQRYLHQMNMNLLNTSSMSAQISKAFSETIQTSLPSCSKKNANQIYTSWNILDFTRKVFLLLLPRHFPRCLRCHLRLRRWNQRKIIYQEFVCVRTMVAWASLKYWTRRRVWTVILVTSRKVFAQWRMHSTYGWNIIAILLQLAIIDFKMCVFRRNIKLPVNLLNPKQRLHSKRISNSYIVFWKSPETSEIHLKEVSTNIFGKHMGTFSL